MVARGDPRVFVFRFKSNEQKLYLNYQVQVSQTEEKEGNNISDYPYEVKLSKYGLVLAVALYNGSVALYSIPEIKRIESPPDSNKRVLPSGGMHPPQLINLDEPCVKISNSEGLVVFSGTPKKKTYKEMIDSMKKPVV